jgi:hypothetical protein
MSHFYLGTNFESGDSRGAGYDKTYGGDGGRTGGGGGYSNRSPACKPLKSNGCGAENGVKFPNIPIGCNFGPACNRHDLCYGSGVSRKKCDESFLAKMLLDTTKKSANWFENSGRFDFEKEITKMFYYPQRLIQDIHAESCRNLAVSYFTVVREMGSGAYNAAQENKRICSGQ